MKIIVKMSISLMVLLISLNVHAEWSQVINGFQWWYVVNNGEAELQRYVNIVYNSYPTMPSPAGEMTIPSRIGSYEVKSIGGGAFKEEWNLTGVTIPNSVKSIGGRAFYYCSGIKQVDFGNGVTNIGSDAFYKCTGLTSIIIPSSVKSIDSYAFQGCSGLNDLTILNGVTNIGNCAFNGCSSLTSLTIPESVRCIGNYAFSECSGLRNLTIDVGVTSIGNNAFEKCSELSGTLLIPGSVNSIGNAAFNGCCGLSGVWAIPSSVTSIGSSAFNDCSGLTGILTIPNSMTRIEQSTFEGCSGLEEVRFGVNISFIGTRAFSGCASASVFSFAGTPPSVGSYVFRNVKSGAIGTYTAKHKAEWEAVIGADGKWNGLIMRECEPLSLTLSASDGTVPGGIEVTWTDGGCEQYELFRGESENGPFTYIATVSGNRYFDSDFSDSGSSAKWGHPYWYYVNRVSGQKGAQPKDGTQRDSNVDVGLTKSGSELPKIEVVDVGELWLSGEGPYYCFLKWNNFDKEHYYVSSITFNLKRSGSRVPVWTSAPKVLLEDGNQIEVFDVSQGDRFLVPHGQHGQHLLEVTWEVSDRQNHQVLEKVTQPCKEPRVFDDVKVFFHKYGEDHAPIPNWLYHWPKDAALFSTEFGQGVDDGGQNYDGLFRYDPSKENFASHKYNHVKGRSSVCRIPGLPTISQLMGVKEHSYVFGIYGASRGDIINSVNYPSYRGKEVGSDEVGLRCVGASIAHEKMHGVIANRTYGRPETQGWIFIGDFLRKYDYSNLDGLRSAIDRRKTAYILTPGNSPNDRDYERFDEYLELIDSAEELGHIITDFDGDGIADSDEEAHYYGDWGFVNTNADVYSLATLASEYSEYSEYGDNEILARDAEQYGNEHIANEHNDWAWPGFNVTDYIRLSTDDAEVNIGDKEHPQWTTSIPQRWLMGLKKSKWAIDKEEGFETLEYDLTRAAQRMSRRTHVNMSDKIQALSNRAKGTRFTAKASRRNIYDNYAISYWHGTASSLSDISVSTGDVHVVSCANAGVIRDGSGRVSSLGWSLVLTNATDEAMTIKLRSYLADSATNELAWAATNVECAVGLTTVEMRFDAEDVFLWDTSRLMLYAVTIESSIGDMAWTVSEQAPCALTAAEYSAADLANDKGRIVPSSVAVIVTSEGVTVSGEVVRVSGDAAQIYASLTETNGLAVTSAMIDAPGVGTNDFSVFFPGDELYRLAKPLPYVVDSVRLAENGETVHEINAVGMVDAEDARWFRPADLTIHALAGSGAWSEPLRGADGLCSQITYSFVVSNAEDTVKACHVRATLLGTNEEHVCSLNLPVELSAGLNTVSMSFSSIDMTAHEYDGGVYRIGNVFVESDDGNEIEVLHTDGNSIAVARNELAGVPFTVKGTPQFCYREVGGTNLASVVVTVEVARPDTITASVLLVDGEGKYVATARTSETVSAAGGRTLTLTFDPAEVKASGRLGPYTISYLLLKSGNEGVEDVRVEDFVVQDVLYLEQVAPPAFSPATKTVFFRREQMVSISCATDAAEVRYTLDGSEPTASSRLYDGAFVITNSVTVKAKAFAEGLSPSETVVAEYVRAAIVGDNLVQTASPTSGVAQTVSVPVPGTYQVSLDWAQGGAFELRLSKGGDVRTIAAISAENAGTTNLLFGIPTIGDYELMVYDPSSGATQPAVVSNLSLSIPDTPENKGRYWIYETENTYGSTGEWIAESGFVNGKMPIKGSNIFNPYTSSTGDHVVITVTLEFGALMLPGYLDEEMSDCKARIAMSQEESGENVFKVFTSEHGENVWKSVYAEGLGAPTLGTPYTFKFTFDYTNGAYTVALVTNETEIPLTDGTTGTFAIANSHDSVVKTVEFVGDSEGGFGNFISLLGSYGDSASRFAEGDTLNLSGEVAALPLTYRQAEWLNSMGVYDAIKAKVGRMGMEDFMVAYLLNLDLTKDGAGLVTFKVSEIDVGETDVTIKVRLDRAGTMQTSDAGDTRDAPINGILKLYGGNSPTERVLLNATEVTDANFGDGDTATFTYPRSGGAKFFRPVIEVPSK